MATRTTSSRRAPTSGGSGRGTRKGRSAPRSPAPKQASRSRIAPRYRRRSEARRQLAGHAPDAVAILLLVVAALTALGLVGSAAGGIGRGLASVAGASFGLAQGAVAVLGVAVAVLLFWWRPGAAVPLAAVEAESGDDVTVAGPAAPAPWRVALGSALLALAALGLLHLATGAPALSAPLADQRHAAGLVGA